MINATGIVLHTNLGRAPLSRRAAEAVGQAARGYSNLEYDLPNRRRGRRGEAAEGLLCSLTGAEGALAVNNNAAAVFLLLSALAAGQGVAISRGELVEIGGGFRGARHPGAQRRPGWWRWAPPTRPGPPTTPPPWSPGRPGFC